jgi:hypothetical protein
LDQPTQPASPEFRGQGLCKLGGVTAIAIGLLLIGEIIVYATLPRSTTVVEHFEVFNENSLVGLLTFDLLGMVAYILFVPTVLALYGILRRTSETVMAVATVLFFVGVAEFFATNTGFSMLSLSDQYATATTDVERERLLAAGQAMLTIFNENAFLVSYVIVSASWTMMATAMLRSDLFSRFTAIAGMLAGMAGIVAVVLEHVTFIDGLAIAIALYFLAIVFLFIWVLLLGRRLYQLGRSGSMTAG